MKVAWIYPKNKKCGISFYSKNYINELIKLLDVDSYDIEEVISDLKINPSLLDDYDLVHIQYETALFYINNKDYFLLLIKHIKKPTIVSLHEVYKNFPGVYPREQIKGILTPIKKLIYDLKHPLQNLLKLHQKKSFYSDVILVHYQFQKEILIEKKLQEDNIKVIELPYEKYSQINVASLTNIQISLGSIGFINLNYDYNYLFDVLEKLTIPWSFKWLGGLRTTNDLHLYNKISNKIKEMKWEDRFIITDWLSDEDFQKEFSYFDILLHFFKNRSSSSSLCKSISFGIPVIATQLPLTEDISKKCNVVLTDPNNSPSAANTIEELYYSKEKREHISNSEFQYANLNTYEIQAKRLLEIYKDTIK